MATSQAQRMAVAKFRAEKCDRIAADVPKGKREEYKQAAGGLGISLASLIQYGVEEFITNHAGEEFKPATVDTQKLSNAERQLLDEFNALPDDAQKHFLKAFKAINQNQAAPMDAQDTKGGD